MTGWLVVNNFIDSTKFKEIYGFLINAGKKHGIDIVMKKTGEIVCAVGERVKDMPDFVLFWDKDVNLAKRLEEQGMRVFNSAEAVEICDSKALTAMRLAKLGVRTPKTYLAPKTVEALGYRDLNFRKTASEKLGYPIIIKEVFGSFGAQVYLAENFESAKEIIKKIGSRDFIMQEFIAESRGRDIRVNVVGGRVCSAMLRYSVNGDFRSNISNGGHMKKAELTAEQEKAALDACRAIGLDFAGVDVLVGKDGESIICEVNSNPHFKSSYECTGVDISEDIIRHIKDRLL